MTPSPYTKKITIDRDLKKECARLGIRILNQYKRKNRTEDSFDVAATGFERRFIVDISDLRKLVRGEPIEFCNGKDGSYFSLFFPK